MSTDQSNTPDPMILDDSDLFNAPVTIEDRVFGASFPTLQWVNGKATAKPKKGAEADIDYTGGFFLSAEHGISLPGGKPYTLITKNGEEIEGFAAKNLVVTPIAYRRCIEVTPEGAKFSTRFAASEYDEAAAMGKAHSKLHLLVVVDGLEDPLVLSCTGFVASRFTAQAGKDRGILPSYGAKVVNRASQIAKKKGKNVQYPLCAFKMTLGAQTEENGEPKFTEVGGKEKSFVTLPAWVDEPTAVVEEALLMRLFVGASRFAQYQEIFRQNEAWQGAWSQENLAKLSGRNDASHAAGSNGAGAPMTAGAPKGNAIPF